VKETRRGYGPGSDWDSAWAASTAIEDPPERGTFECGRPWVQDL